ncbi:MAG: HYR domain-containing protein [Flavobacteriales bacterium]|nr:HYR domain-containing protein [Flavobacteriales bacterium]MCB9197361.1 HYR domain-containing protein [Flavobacteriales bacterium]
MRRLLFVLTLGYSALSISAQTPTLNCPSNISLATSHGDCGTSVTFSTPICASNCAGTNIYQSDNTGLSSGDFFPVGIYNIEYTISNGIDSSTCSFQINILDTETPTVNLPASIDVYKDANCEYTLPYLPHIDFTPYTDNCGIDTVIQSPVPGTIISGSSSSISFTTYDIHGNTSTNSFTINIIDTLAPVISSCPGTITEPITSGCSATLQNYIALVSVADNCDPNPVVTQSPASGTSFTTSQTVTIYAEDMFGNIDSCVFTVVSNDILAPTVSCPNDTVVGVDYSCEFVLPDFGLLATATDNCDPNITFTQSPAIGSKLSGANTSYFVSLTGADVAGNSSVCSFQVTLIDTLAPTFDNCKDTILYVNHNCQLSTPNLLTFLGVNENCSSFTTMQVPSAGTIINGATTTQVFYTATDLSSNSATCIMNIITADSTRPNIASCPGNMTVNTSSSSCDYTVTDYSSLIFATDNCSSVFTYTQSEPIGTLLAAGSTYPVTVNVLDDAGNSNSCSFDVTVVDNVAPSLTCLNNPSVPTDNNCDYIIPSYDTIVFPTDNCGNVTFSQTPLAGTVISGIGTQQSISLFAQDDEGNQSSCSFTITIADTTRPTVSCPGTQSITIDANCQYQIPDLSSLVTFNDFCDGSPSYAQSPMAGTTVSSILTVNITITDASGNSNSCSVVTQPDDVTPPTIICPNDMASCSPVFTFNTPNGTDNCGIVTVTQTDATGYASGDTFPEGVTTLEFTATDEVGNTSSCQFNIEVYPTPTISFGGPYSIAEGDSVQLEAFVTNDSAFSWSPTYSMSLDSTLTPWVKPTITLNYTLDVISVNGCTASGEIEVTVDQIAELIINNFLSPNEDGKNDFWTMNKPALISGCNVSIYDRWGKLIWESNAYNNQWDGTNAHGKELPDGTYFYQITCATGEPIKGSILLMR